MSIKRKDLVFLDDEDLSIDEKKKRILDLIHEEVDSVRDERDEIQSRLEEITANLETEKTAREKAEQDLTIFRDETEKRQTRTVKENAYRQILQSLKMSDKRVETVLRTVDWDKVEMDGTSLKDSDALTESIKTEWSEFIPAVEIVHAGVDDPPRGGGKKSYSEMTMEEYKSARYGK